jgi:hypothetical protein
MSRPLVSPEAAVAVAFGIRRTADVTATPATLHAQWLAGHAAARSQAAALARLYAKELIRMAVDDAMLDSAHCGDRSPEGLARSATLDISMWEKAKAGHTAEDIANAIELMQPTVADPPS